MASIFTGLAFMHGHIVDRELVIELGRTERVAGSRLVKDLRRTQPTEKPREPANAVACAAGRC